jgi:hypothetical protein
MQALLAAAGGALAKCVLLRWMAPAGIDGPPLLPDLAADGSSTLVEALLGDARARPTLERLGADAARDLARCLAGHRASEGGGGPAASGDEGSARVLALLRDALDAEALTPGALVDLGLKAPALAERLGRRAEAAAGRLTEAERDLLGRCADFAARYVLERADEVPEVRAATSAALLEGVGRTLERVGRLDGRLAAATAEGDARFRELYRDRLAEILDVSEIYGLNLRPDFRRFSLDQTYVELAMARERLNADGSVSSGVPEPASRLLDAGPLLLVRGVAGSGKTSFLSWLALQSLKRRLPAHGGWNDALPFIVNLREWSDGLPGPERFCDRLIPNHVGEMPHGWVNRQLRAERTLILVDGYDELPPPARKAVLPWLRGLIRDTNRARCRLVVTSRPDALGPGDLADLGFASAEIQPMNAFVVDLMVTKWHACVREQLVARLALTEADVGELETALRSRLYASPILQVLASNPLLCALICILNVVRRSKLGENITRIFELSVGMLIDGRDEQRGIPFQIGLDPDQLMSVLRKIAFHMTLNQRWFLSRTEALDEIQRLMPYFFFTSPNKPAFSQYDVKEEDILNYCIDRVGLLRTSRRSGEVHFIHQRFQEYFAASEALETRSVVALAERAHEEWWSNVVTIAAWMAGSADREQLLGELLARVRQGGPNARRVALVALTAVKEGAGLLSPALQREIEALAHALEAPRSLDEAPAFGAAGWAFLRELRYARGRGEEQTIACIRSLCEIGGRQGLDILRGYARDSRFRVVVELLRAWERFPQELYGERVARRVRFKGEAAVVDGGKLWTRVRLVAEGHALEPFEVCLRSDTLLAQLGNLSGLRKLELSKVDGLEHLRGFERLKRLEHLVLEGCERLGDIGAVAAMRGLKILNLSWCQTPMSLRPLLACARLESVNLIGTEPLDLDELSAMPRACRFGVSAEQHLNALRRNPNLEVRFLGYDAD